jgi:hypothetical protein
MGSEHTLHPGEIENNTWARGDDIELEHKKINSCLQASMYHFVYYINISLKSRKKIMEIAD